MHQLIPYSRMATKGIDKGTKGLLSWKNKQIWNCVHSKPAQKQPALRSHKPSSHQNLDHKTTNTLRQKLLFKFIFFGNCLIMSQTILHPFFYFLFQNASNQHFKILIADIHKSIQIYCIQMILAYWLKKKRYIDIMQLEKTMIKHVCERPCLSPK